MNIVKKLAATLGLLGLVGTSAYAGGVSVCNIGVSTPTAAVVLCSSSAVNSLTLYGVEFSSNITQVSGNTQLFVDIYDSNTVSGLALGSDGLNKIMSAHLDTAKLDPVGAAAQRNAAKGIVVTHNNVTVPFRVLFSNP